MSAPNRPRVTILAIGNEIISGKTTDTNSSYLSSRLTNLGFQMHRIIAVADLSDEIASELKRAGETSDLIFTTGGLGPTSDDLTRQAIALVAGVPLEENLPARKKLEDLYAARKRQLNPNNYRQVEFPKGAEILNNRIGTADGFVSRIPAVARNVPVVSLPGVPRELDCVYSEVLRAWLEKEFVGLASPPMNFSLRCFGCSESYLGRQIESCKLNPELEVAYRPSFPELLLTFTHHGEATLQTLQDELHRCELAVRDAIGNEFILTRDPTSSLPQELGKLLRERKLTLSAAESCSGGLLASLLVSIPGASAFFSSSVVSYSNEAKSVFLGVRPAILERYGAVSPEVATEMARGAKFRVGASIGVSITGIAGPDGGSEAKPVGTFFIGLVTDDTEVAFEHFFPHDRDYFRMHCASLALDLVRRKVLGLPLQWERK